MTGIPRRRRPIGPERQATVNDAMVPGSFTGRLPAVAPVVGKKRLDARARGITSTVSVTSRSSMIDQFTLSSSGAQSKTLTYQAIIDSWNVSLNGVTALDTTDYTISGQTLSLLTALDPRSGDVVQVQYDYLTGVPVAPISSTYAAAVMADNPVAYWRLDDTGSTNADYTSHHLDAVYTAGSYTRGLASLLPTEPNKSSSLGSNSTYWTVPSSSLFNTSAISIELWTTHGNSGSLSFWEHPGRCKFNLGGGIGYFYLWISGAWVQMGTTFDNNWSGTGTTARQLGVSYDGTTVRFFKNGAQYGADITNPGTLLSSASSPLMGGQGNDPVGALDEFSVYGTALTATNFAAHYGAA